MPADQPGNKHNKKVRVDTKITKAARKRMTKLETGVAGTGHLPAYKTAVTAVARAVTGGGWNVMLQTYMGQNETPEKHPEFYRALHEKEKKSKMRFVEGSAVSF